MELLNKIFAWFYSIGKDRYMHFAFGAVIATVAVIATCWLPSWLSLTLSAVTVIGASIVKEVTIDDMADYVDAICTIAGGAAVWLPIIALLVC